MRTHLGRRLADEQVDVVEPADQRQAFLEEMSRSGQRPAPARCLDLGHDARMNSRRVPLAQVDRTGVPAAHRSRMPRRPQRDRSGRAMRSRGPARRAGSAGNAGSTTPCATSSVEPQRTRPRVDLLDQQQHGGAEPAGEPGREAVRRRRPRTPGCPRRRAPWRPAATPALCRSAAADGSRPASRPAPALAAGAASARPYCSMASSAMRCAAVSSKPIRACASRTASAKGPPPGTRPHAPALRRDRRQPILAGRGAEGVAARRA